MGDQVVQQEEETGKIEVTLPVNVPDLTMEYENKTAEDIILWAIETYGSRLAISTSLQAEGMVILDLAYQIDPTVRVFTVDTGRLPQETYDLIDRTREQYGVSIEVYHPDQNELSAMVGQHGINSFYRSVSLRLLCCNIRKVNPVNRALKDVDAWISGLRRSHGEARSRTAKVEVDSAHGSIIKVNPLADWSYEQWP